MTSVEPNGAQPLCLSVSFTEKTYLEVNIILRPSFTLGKKLLWQMKNYTMIKRHCNQA